MKRFLPNFLISGSQIYKGGFEIIQCDAQKVELQYLWELTFYSLSLGSRSTLGFFFHFRDGVGGIGGRRQGEGIGDKKSCIRVSVFYYSIMMVTELLQTNSLRKCVLCELISYVILNV